MTRASPRRLFGPLCAALVCVAVWYCFPAMEMRSKARLSPAATAAAVANPMLAAGRLLERHRHAVRTIDTLDDVALHSLPDGTLILANVGGLMPAPQAVWLMAWVERGNTLLFVPKWMRKDAASKPGADPIGERLGVALAAGMNLNHSCDGARQDPDTAAKRGIACLTVPGRPYALEIDSGDEILQSVGKGSAPLWSDPDGRTVRVYAHGKGHVVLLAANYFDNDKLSSRDHAELLLALGELDTAARAVLIVQRLGVPHWYLALWSRFQPAIIGAAICLLLLLWSAARRFGPPLPEADAERRALMEHVDASGKWLWRTAAGRAILLDAARRRAERALERRAPHLLRLAPAERKRDLARLCRLAEADIDAALFQPAASQPALFTRQIRTLQQVRTHYER